MHEGVLLANHASTISKCLKNLPVNVSENDKIKAESLLVEKAQTVRVCDIHAHFEEILGWIDPDGQETKEATDGDSFADNLRQAKDGTWTLKGRLDEESGEILNGLLTSRIKTDSPSGDGSRDDESIGEDGCDKEVDDLDKEIVDTFPEVLCGDRSDCLDPSLDFSQPQIVANEEILQGAGIKQNGTLVAMAAEQPSVRRRIYKRFSSVIGSIEMNCFKAGAAYAMVVTAKAEDLANRTGKAITSAEAPFPINSAVLKGLNGSVFFHPMGKDEVDGTGDRKTSRYREAARDSRQSRPVMHISRMRHSARMVRSAPYRPMGGKRQDRHQQSHLGLFGTSPPA